jgi:hypothetical protein
MSEYIGTGSTPTQINQLGFLAGKNRAKNDDVTIMLDCMRMKNQNWSWSNHLSTFIDHKWFKILHILVENSPYIG